MATDIDPEAPHGRDEDGTPFAPFGLTKDGKPRRSNRGARPGEFGNGGSTGRTRTPRKPAAPKGVSAADLKMSQATQKEQLLALADMFLVVPLATASVVPWVSSLVGARHTDALAGDALILNHYAPPLADGLVALAETKPSVLAWLGAVTEKAPYLMLAKVGADLAKAVIGNHMNPDPRVTAAGRTLAQLKIQAMAIAVEEEARAAGFDIPEPGEQAA